MIIEIHQPELESLIRQQLAGGRFRDVEDVLLQALQAMPPAELEAPPKKNPTQFLKESPLWASGLVFERSHRTGADLIQAMQASPHKEVDIEPTRPHLPVRDIAL